MKMGVAVDPGKVQRVKDWTIPKTIEELRSFLGLSSYYRRFIPGFASIAGPLHALTAKIDKKAGNSPSVFTWSDVADEAFCKLKSLLCTAPVLAYPNFDKDFILEVDASLKGLGACLLQPDGEGALHPIAYERC